LRWRKLGALEAVLDEISDEVDGEDVLNADGRAVFDETRAQLERLHQETTARGGRCVLGRPRREEIEALRQVATQGRRR
jgi:hypothetical protein